jgi:hypothetical protein
MRTSLANTALKDGELQRLCKPIAQAFKVTEPAASNQAPPRPDPTGARILSASQDKTSKSQQGDGKTAEAKKANEKKSELKVVEVHFKVSVEESGDLPPNTKIEISGREAACGSLQTDDAVLIINENGEAVFKGLPVCNVAVRVNHTGYLPWRQTFDLADYKEPIQITLKPGH